MTATPVRELEQAPFTASDLTAWVHETMDANGGDRGVAIRKVVTDLADQMRGEARMWWLSLGHEMVRRVVVNQEGRGHRYETGGVPPSEQNESVFDATEGTFLDAWVPYSLSEKAKPVGDFTEDNWRSFEAMRRRQAETMIADADRAADVARHLDGDETTRNAWGDLPDDLREWVEKVAKGR